MKSILYLHGFASSPDGRKVALLRGILSATGFRVVAPDLNLPSFERLDFEAMVGEAIRVAELELPAVVVGSSLGALVALGAARRGFPAPLVLIAPALGFGQRWTEKLAPGDPVKFFHHGQGRELRVHRRFFEHMVKVDVDRDPPAAPVAILMGQKDESVPYEGVLDVWKRWEKTGLLAAGSRLIAIPDGDHGLIGHVDRIAAEIGIAANTETRARPR